MLPSAMIENCWLLLERIQIISWMDVRAEKMVKDGLRKQSLHHIKRPRWISRCVRESGAGYQIVNGTSMG